MIRHSVALFISFQALYRDNVSALDLWGILVYLETFRKCMTWPYIWLGLQAEFRTGDFMSQ